MLCQGMIQIVIDSLRKEGPNFVMKVWTPALLRLA